MIEGIVNARYEAVISLTVFDTSGQPRRIEATLDTGFNGFLLLPTEIVLELGLPFLTPATVRLADGSEDYFDICGAVISWDGQMVARRAHVSDGDALIGMRMLDGYNLNMDVEPGGRALIRAIGGECL